ncbi:MAG: hypothetical protein DDT32_02242 [Syntrophomonadaceae bacterium]|nr:hypothetical protein [Bacillota bacterium]
MVVSYLEKLRDPRWQKKRLEILERDNWTCQLCADIRTTLHVHHFTYIPGKEPWEYPAENYITLCEDCHNTEAEERVEYESMLLAIFKEKRFLPEDIYNLVMDIMHSPSLRTLSIDGH